MASEMASETEFPLPGFIPGDDAAGSDGPASAPHQDSPAPDAPPSGTRADDMDDEAAFNTRFTARLREHENEQRMRWQAQVEQWRREVARDPDLGGDNLSASVARAQLALDRFDQDRSIGRLLEQSGYGNHPAVIRFFNRMADALMEDSTASGRPEHDLPPLEERMYAGWSSGG